MPDGEEITTVNAAAAEETEMRPIEEAEMRLIEETTEEEGLRI